LFETIRLMLSEQVYDVIETTRAALAPLELHSVNDVRAYPQALVNFSVPMQEASSALKQFLSANLYRHPRVLQTTEQAKEIIKDLFLAYLHTPSEMPESFHGRHDRERSVADYIAGMTDRFAAKEHQRLSGWSPLQNAADLPLDHQPGLGLGRARADKALWSGLQPNPAPLPSRPSSHPRTNPPPHPRGETPFGEPT
jgi:hypothetical protein